MKSDVIFVIGANPTDGHPVFASRMKRRLREGARLIVADPRAIDLVHRRTSRPTSTCRCGPAPTWR
jgi:predicted molibdopterin-dependent oxidoreductase YjgC